MNSPEKALTRQIALLRGINVGRHNQVSMPLLRDLAHDLGYERVGTYLRSGNVVFSAATPPEYAAESIEKKLHARLGLSVNVLGRGRDELAEIVASNPFGELASDPTKLFVLFLADRP